ncbi:hypothetical protein N9H52_00815 [Gammaproteobacteria bacterium]|nr:hypothetical protein [Gammaproteobacteria bacterium]
MDSLTIFFVASNIFSIALLCVGMIYTYNFVNWSLSSIKLSEENKQSLAKWSTRLIRHGIAICIYTTAILFIWIINLMLTYLGGYWLMTS